MMKKKLFILLSLVQVFILNAEILRNDFIFTDKIKDVVFELGDKFNYITSIYPDLQFIGDKKYSNIVYKQYAHKGIIFSISAYAEDLDSARIIRIQITSSNFITQRGLTVGSTKADVVLKYGEPEYVIGTSYYYYNEEYDVLELVFKFDEKGFVDVINMTAGT